MHTIRQAKIVSVVGGRNCSKKVEELAHNLGKKLAKVVDVCVCGGLGGTMVAAARGFKKGGGRITVGILPSYCKSDANKYIDIPIPTGLGLARNVLVVTSGDVVIALPGESGTLSEIAYCLQFGIPVISLLSWEIPGVVKADTVNDAVQKARALLSQKRTKTVRMAFVRRRPWQRRST